MKKVKIKVCGLTTPENIAQIEQVHPAYIGFVFASSSPRKITLDSEEPIETLSEAERVGVFVNQPLDEILAAVHGFNLDCIQLHGEESPEVCRAIKKVLPAIQIIKAFGVDAEFDFAQTKPYQDVAAYMLFDTKSPERGGTGKQFEWKQLEQYRGPKPFFLSGGIALSDIGRIHELNIQLPLLYAVDINSRFETAPGIKDPALVESFITGLTHGTHC